MSTKISTPRMIKNLISYSQDSHEEKISYPSGEIHDVINEGNSFLHSISYAILPSYSSASKDEKVELIKRFRVEMAADLTIDKFKKMKIYPIFLTTMRGIDSKVEIPISVTGVLHSLRDFYRLDSDLLDEVLCGSYSSYLKSYSNPVGEEIEDLICERLKVDISVFDDTQKPPVSVYKAKDSLLHLSMARKVEFGNKVRYYPITRNDKKYTLVEG
jgi:hypothetical protein